MVLTSLEQVQSDYNALGASLEAYTASLPKPKPLPELGAYIVDNGSYGTALTARLKSYIDVLAKSEFKHVYLFQNYLQMVKDKFPQVILDAGLMPIFDTMIAVWRTTTPVQRVEYMTQAEKFNPPGYKLDDAHNQLPEELATIVKFMRGYTDKPIYASFGADDTKLVNGKRIVFDMQAYVDAGLIPTRQFFRQELAGGKTQEARTGAVGKWLKAQLPRSKGGEGRIIGGVDLEAFEEDGVTTSPGDFTDMLLQCLNAGIDVLAVHAAVNGNWLIWKNAPALWEAVNAGAVTVRLWKQ